MKKIKRRLLLGLLSIVGTGLATYYYKNQKNKLKEIKNEQNSKKENNLEIRVDNKKDSKEKIEEIVNLFTSDSESKKENKNYEKNSIKNKKFNYNELININIEKTNHSMEKVKPILPVKEIKPVEKIKIEDEIKNKIAKIKKEISEKNQKNIFDGNKAKEKTDKEKSSLDTIVNFFANK